MSPYFRRFTNTKWTGGRMFELVSKNKIKTLNTINRCRRVTCSIVNVCCTCQQVGYCYMILCQTYKLIEGEGRTLWGCSKVSHSSYCKLLNVHLYLFIRYCDIYLQQEIICNKFSINIYHCYMSYYISYSPV